MRKYVLLVLVLLTLSGCTLSALPGSNNGARRHSTEPPKRRDTSREGTPASLRGSLPLGAASHLYLGSCL